VAQSFARVRHVLTRLIADSAREFDLQLELPAEHLAVAIDALADGIARQKLADPQAVPDDLMERVLSLLLAGATRPAGEGVRQAGTRAGSAQAGANDSARSRVTANDSARSRVTV
jgi:hypothetical protein